MDEELNNENQEEQVEQVEQVEEPVNETESTDEVEENTAEETETKEESSEEQITYDEAGLQKLADANKTLQDLTKYTTEKDDSDRYEYDDIEEMWHDKTTDEYYDERPELKRTKVFDAERYYIDKTQQEIHNIKQQIVDNTEKELIDMLNTSLGDIANNLTAEQYDTLKKDALGPYAKQFAEDLLDDVVDGEYIIDLKRKCRKSIDDRLSLYNIRSQAQDNINNNHETKYPLESQEPTNVSGMITKGTWENSSQSEIDKWKQRLADFLTGGNR